WLGTTGAVVTHAAQGTSSEGLDAEWRMIGLLTVGGDRIYRCELFDESDLDTALARFEELQPLARRLENAASPVADRQDAHFAAGAWDAVPAPLAEAFVSDDRRRVVNSGIRSGRDAAIQDGHANADMGLTDVASTVIAIRGERLALRRSKYSGSAQKPGAF